MSKSAFQRWCGTVLAGAAGLLLLGCSGGSSATPELNAQEAQVLAEAPRDWAAFKTWCENELRKTNAPVPLPNNPNLSAAKWPVNRLVDDFAKAQVACAWSQPTQATSALVHLGPFRSDRPSDNFSANTKFDRQLGDYVELHVSGFWLQCDEVGMIRISLRAPFGRFVDLVWGRAGQLRVPVPDNQQHWTLSLATDGLSEWTGTLNDLLINTDGQGEAPIEIDALDFLPRQGLFDKPADSCRITIDKIRHDALYSHSPGDITFPNVKIPADGKLAVSIASARNDRPGTSAPATTVGVVTFDVRARAGGQTVPLLQRRPEQPEQWYDLNVSLAQFAGQTIDLVLHVEGGGPDHVGLWGAPTIYQPVANPPIFLVYLIDTLAARHLSLYGHDRPTSPRLGQLAERGVWFGEMRTQAPVTVASLPQMVLSMPTERHRVYMPSLAIPLPLVTMAESFQAAGFATGSFVTSEYAGPRQNMDQGFEYFSNQVSVYWRNPHVDRTVPIDEVLGWLKDHSDRPAFMYIHTAEPHAPYFPPPGFAGKFDPNYTGSIDGSMDPTTGFMGFKTARDVEHVKALYDEEVLYADQRFGMFEDALKAGGFLDRTNIFVLADHGEEMQEHGNWGHGPALYDEVLRIPLIAAGPGITARGRNDSNVCMYDVLPTILDLGGLPQPYPLSGVSLAGMLRGSEKAPPELKNRTLIVGHFRNSGYGILDYAVTEALRWKLYVRVVPKGNLYELVYELYDLKADPLEKNNLLDREHETARRLAARLVVYHRQQHPYPNDNPALQFDPRQLRDLRSMGYIGDDGAKD